MFHIIGFRLHYINFYKVKNLLNGMKEEMKRYWLESFDMEDSRLASIFSEAAIEIDDFIIGRDFGSKPTRRLGKTICLAFEQQEFRDKVRNNFYLNNTISNDLGDTNLDYQRIGLELIQFRRLPREKQEQLRGLCVSLSRIFSSYWNQKHPNGFKHYAA